MKVSLYVTIRFKQIWKFNASTVHEHCSKQTEWFARFVDTIKYDTFHSICLCLLTNTLGHCCSISRIVAYTICAQHVHFTVGVRSTTTGRVDSFRCLWWIKKICNKHHICQITTIQQEIISLYEYDHQILKCTIYLIKIII